MRDEIALAPRRIDYEDRRHHRPIAPPSNMRASIAMRTAIILALLVVPACTSATPDAKPIADVRPSEATPREDPPAADTAPVVADTDCEGLVADYLAKRAAASHCKHDSDCAEMWPGLCPQGPYYVNRTADVAPIVAREVAILKNCSTPECEPPMELGIAHCEAGTCARGRTPSTSGGAKSCWDFRETNLEADGITDAETVVKVKSTTPHIVISPAAAGTLELEVTPGAYHMIGTSTAPARFLVRAQLSTSSGEPGSVTRHGVGWQRVCED